MSQGIAAAHGNGACSFVLAASLVPKIFAKYMKVKIK